mmetsp:Transcript_11148/g.27391  ORF Transcript_11148/g.27391 Transcript_11148/m.27391 type:complete len:97 (+) Transcript_11148:367-657(+)
MSDSVTGDVHDKGLPDYLPDTGRNMAFRDDPPGGMAREENPVGDIERDAFRHGPPEKVNDELPILLVNALGELGKRGRQGRLEEDRPGSCRPPQLA